jgi:hypothetical protein
MYVPNLTDTVTTTHICMLKWFSSTKLILMIELQYDSGIVVSIVSLITRVASVFCLCDAASEVALT